MGKIQVTFHLQTCKDVNSQMYPFPFESSKVLTKINTGKKEIDFTLFRTDFASSPFRASDCAEKDCIRGFGTRERLVGEGVSCCIDGAASHEFVLEVDFESRGFLYNFEDFDCFGSDFRTDSIACKYANGLFRHDLSWGDSNFLGFISAEVGCRTYRTENLPHRNEMATIAIHSLSTIQILIGGKTIFLPRREEVWTLMLRRIIKLSPGWM